MAPVHESEPPRPPDQSWKKAFLNHPVRFKPGTHFVYNTQATYMLSAIIEKTNWHVRCWITCGPRIFEPLGITNPTWEKSPEGITAGGFGLSIRTEDIARFGQLYLQKGKWQDKQLVPESWVEAATSLQIANGSNPKSDWDQGYGISSGAAATAHFARRRARPVLRRSGKTGHCRRHHQWRGDLQSVLNLVWDKLLPGLTEKALPADQAVMRGLARALKNLSLHQLETTASPSKALDKMAGQKYTFRLMRRNWKHRG